MLEFADIVVGLAWGDEAKGKITSQLASTGEYTAVARWAGGNNAGHTVYVNGEKYKTHLIPSGIFYGIKSIIGPGCVLHPQSFYEEVRYLEERGFDTTLIKISPRCHIVTNEHIEIDKNKLANKLGTTSKGIAPVYAAKMKRAGILAKDYFQSNHMGHLLWDEKLSGRLLCEGAQGIWLDIDHGNYPYVTSSTTISYGACSIGFPPQLIRNIWGAAKIYDTRSGEDPLFPNSLLENDELSKIGQFGNEIGVTTGRRRKVNWLDLNKLINAINLSGCTHLVISKCDILKELELFKMYTYGSENKLIEFKTIEQLKNEIRNHILEKCSLVKEIYFSSSPEKI